MFASTGGVGEEWLSSSDGADTAGVHMAAVCDFLKRVFLGGTRIHKRQDVCAPSRLTMRMITEDIWVLMKDFLWCQSIKLIHTCQKKEQKCAIVVMWSSQDSTWRGWWWGDEWQLVPWLSAQHSHDLPWVYLYAAHTVTWSPTSQRFHIKDKWLRWYVGMTAWILKKMTIILIFCPNFSGI